MSSSGELDRTTLRPLEQLGLLSRSHWAGLKGKLHPRLFVLADVYGRECCSSASSAGPPASALIFGFMAGRRGDRVTCVPPGGIIAPVELTQEERR